MRRQEKEILDQAQINAILDRALICLITLFHHEGHEEHEGGG